MSATKNASVSRSTGSRGPSDTETISGYPPAYEAALRIADDNPGTVCVNLAHYQNRELARGHFHEQPYREGYCHRYRLPDEHWHADYRELLKCDEENYDR